MDVKSTTKFANKVGPREIRHNFVFNLDRKNIDKLFYLKRLFDKLPAVKGDIVECGVGESRTFQMFCLLMAISGSRRKIWGFDSFAGFPEPGPEDESPRQAKKGEWNVMSVDQVYEALWLIGLSREFINNQVRIVEGYFDKTIPEAKIRKIALLHIDADLYSSYKTCLKYFFPKVIKGGVVIFDEYKNPDEKAKWPGAYKAIDEYFAGERHKISHDKISGKYYLIKR